jgi:hypothetical protein
MGSKIRHDRRIAQRENGGVRRVAVWIRRSWKAGARRAARPFHGARIPHERTRGEWTQDMNVECSRFDDGEDLPRSREGRKAQSQAFALFAPPR